MIDITKNYTYHGKPVRIYADGSDTKFGYIHCGMLMSNGWNISETHESNLIEVWQPKEGEVVFCWNPNDKLPTISYFDKYIDAKYWMKDSYGYKFCALFPGTLPDAFKGIVND